MKKIYFLLPLFLFLLWEIATAKLELRNVVVNYDYYGNPKTMHVMASNTRGTSMRPKYSANIYCSPHYGYYEVFMCANMYWKQYTTGCLHEIATEKSFRFANVATPDFSWFIDKFTRYERQLVNKNTFELCIIDGTEHMRKSSLKKSQASLGQRIQMPRYCWVIKLEYRPISDNTLLEMQRATKLELKGKREKLSKYKKQFEESMDANKKFHQELRIKFTEATDKLKYLEAENVRLKEELERARTNINIDILGKSTIEIEMNQKEIKQKEIQHNEVEEQLINITEEVKERYEHTKETRIKIEKYNAEGQKTINNMEKECAGLENKAVELEKNEIGANNNAGIKPQENIANPRGQKNNLNPKNPALGLNEEDKKKIELELHLDLDLNKRKKRNASNKIIDLMEINNQLKADKTNGKLKEMEDGMIKDSQGPAFSRSIEEKLAKLDQDFKDIMRMKEHWITEDRKNGKYSKKAGVKGPTSHSIEEELAKGEKLIRDIEKEQEDRKNGKYSKKAGVIGPTSHSIEEELAKGEKLIRDIEKEQEERKNGKYSKKAGVIGPTSRSIEEELAKGEKLIRDIEKEQEERKNGKYSKKAGVIGPTSRSIEEELAKGEKLIRDIEKEQEERKNGKYSKKAKVKHSEQARKEELAKTDEDFENFLREHGLEIQHGLTAEKRKKMRENVAKGNEKIKKILKEHGIQHTDLKVKGPFFDQHKEEEFTKMNEEIDKIRKENETRKKEFARANEEMEKIWKEHGIKDKLEIKPFFTEARKDELAKIDQNFEKIKKEHGIKYSNESEIRGPTMTRSMEEKLERMNQKIQNLGKEHLYSNESEITGLTINGSTVENLVNKSPEKLSFHAKKAIFSGKKKNKGKENVIPHAKIVPKFADVPLGNLEWKCEKFHGKNAENCHKWKKIASEWGKKAKIEYRSVLPSGKCSAKILGEIVLKHSILNASNMAKGSNGKDGVKIANAPFTQEECKEKLHKGMNNRQKRNVDDEITWEQLDKIVPKKQAMLFKMASNNLLTVGSIEFDDYQNEIATITNVNPEQLLDYDEKKFEKLGEKFGKEIFHKIAPKRMEKIITDAKDTAEDVIGIYSALKMVEEDNKKIDETIKNIEEEEKKLISEGVSVDDYCRKECTALIEYDEKEVEKEKNEQEIKKGNKGKEIVEQPELKESKVEHSVPIETKAEHSVPKESKVEHSVPKESKVEHSVPKESKVEHSVPKESKVEHSVPIETKAEHSVPKESKVEHSLAKESKAEYSVSKESKAEHSEPKVTKAEYPEPKVTKNKDKGIEIVEHTVPKGTKEVGKGEEIKGDKKTEEMKESEIIESEIEHHGQPPEAIHNTNGVLSKIYSKSKEHLVDAGKFVAKKSWEMASHIGNTVIQTATNTMAKKQENTSDIGDTSQPAVYKTPGTAHIHLGHQKYLPK